MVKKILVTKYPALYKRVDNGQYDITTALYKTLDECKCHSPVSLLMDLGQQCEEVVDETNWILERH